MQEVLSFSSSAESARGQEGILPARHASRAKIDLEKGFKKVLTLLHTENIELRARVTTIEAALAAPKKSVAHASSQTTVDGSTVDANADVLWRLETLEHVVLAKDGPTSDAPRPQRAQGSRSETLDHQRMRKEHQLLRDRFLQLQREVAQQVVQQQLQQVEHLQSQMEQLKLTQEEIQATLELLENSSTSPGRVVLEGVQQQMQRRTEQLQRQLDAAEAVAMESEIHLKALDAPGAAADEKPMSTQDGTRNPALDRIRQDDGYTDRASVSAKAARQALCRVSGSSSATAGADMDAAAQHAAQQWVDVVEQRFTQA
ncbi:hypothetical protein AB1Y20_000394 [Prymnesium parvum]|uniref:Protein CASP n=1 Tax=Prymnesium parvum TaxID=97485 RepID=A0AB34K7U0_PRYPA